MPVGEGRVALVTAPLWRGSACGLSVVGIRQVAADNGWIIRSYARAFWEYFNNPSDMTPIRIWRRITSCRFCRKRSWVV